MGCSPSLLPLTLLAAACGQRGEPVQAVKGSLVWTVEFDAEAEERGFSDCTYRRSYDGTTDRSAPWLCPECEAVFRADVRLSGASCYAQISQEEASEVDWIGWADDVFRRASTEHFRLSEQGSAREIDGERVIRNRAEPTEIADGGSFTLAVDGSLRVGEGRGDPMWGFSPVKNPACGWSRRDPPAYEGDFALQAGALLPDGWFLDACGEAVRLHDQLGRYLVITVSAVDCPPCQDMAAAEEAFLGRMEEEQIEVGVVTLLAPTLDRVLDPTPVAELEEWERVFGLSSPVLADRGWGLWLGLDALGDAYGYPTTVLVRPDGTVFDLFPGYAGWDPIRLQIRADAEGAR